MPDIDTAQFARDVLVLPTARRRQSRIRLMPFDEVRVSTEPNYLIKGLLARGGLIVVWGPPKSGKSFWVFDMMMHVALGNDYRGRRVIGGRVVYIAAEGAVGVNARVEAFRQEHLTDYCGGPVPFFLVPMNLDLVGEHGALIDAIRMTLGEHTSPAAVVIDTLNRTLRGSESSDQDMSAYIVAADAIREALGCAVIIVHHCGIDSTRPRGHTSLGGAVDTQIAVKRDKAGVITAVVEWMKDSSEGETERSVLEQVEVGQDSDGDPITSCVVKPAAHEVTCEPSSTLTRNQMTMFSILHDARSGGLALEEWNERAREAGLGLKRKPDLYDLRKALQRKKLVYESNGRWHAQR